MIFAAVVIASAISAAGSDLTQSCVQIDLAPAHFARLEADERSGTHLWFPEQVAYSVVANEALWEFSAYGQHFFLKPAVDSGGDGSSTTLTIITESRAYDFRVIRQSSPTTHCYRVNHATAQGGLASAAFGGQSHATVPQPSAPTLTKPATPIIASQPALINTAYRYGSPLLAVWDDGRRTYVRCDVRVPGLEAAILTGPSGGVVSYSYDQATATFTVDGVHGALDVVLAGAHHAVRRVESRR